MKKTIGALACVISAIVTTFLAVPDSYAASNPIMKQDEIVLNGNKSSSPSGAVYNDTTYMPIWYITDVLKKAGIENTWNGSELDLTAGRQFPIQLTNLNPENGPIAIKINATLVERVSGLTLNDPATNRPTTYVPIWYLMQVLNRLSIRSNWDGTVWNVWTTPLFGQQLQAFLASRSSTVSIAVYDANSGKTEIYQPQLRFDTASIVKATILAELLHRSKITGIGLSSEEQSLFPPMIEYSDNSAASTLWDLAGRSSGIEQFLMTVGMTQTTPAHYGYWGLTQTSAANQVLLMRQFAYHNNILTDSERAYGLNLFEHVVSWERWGVSSGATNDTTVALKNGWLPIGAEGWEINTIGYVNGEGRNYVIAILSRNNPSEAYGIATVDGVSQILWNEL